MSIIKYGSAILSLVFSISNTNKNGILTFLGQGPLALVIMLFEDGTSYLIDVSWGFPDWFANHFRPLVDLGKHYEE